MSIYTSTYYMRMKLNICSTISSAVFDQWQRRCMHVMLYHVMACCVL